MRPVHSIDLRLAWVLIPAPASDWSCAIVCMSASFGGGRLTCLFRPPSTRRRRVQPIDKFAALETHPAKLVICDSLRSDESSRFALGALLAGEYPDESRWIHQANGYLRP